MTSSELAEVLELARSGIPPGRSDVAEARHVYEAFCKQLPMPVGLVTEPVDAGGVPALLVGPPAPRLVVHLHGGGFAIGSAHGYRAFGARLAAAADARVLLVDYRRSPEHRFPAAHDDALAAVRWALDQGDAPVLVSGDSAGGNLALASLVALRDAGGPQAAAGLLWSPWLDLSGTTSDASFAANEKRDPMVARAAMGALCRAYVGDGDPRGPAWSPLFADLTGLPPLLVTAGGAEAILGDSEALAAAGGDVELHVEPRMPHVYPLFAGMLDEADAAIARAAAFVGERLA